MPGRQRIRERLEKEGKWPPPGHWFSMLNKDRTPKDPPNDAAVLFSEHGIKVTSPSGIKHGWRQVREKEWRQGRIDALRLRDPEMADRIEARIMEIQTGKIALGDQGSKPSKRATKQEIKQGFETVFDLLGGIEGLAAYAALNPEKFYNLYARMLPKAEKVQKKRARGDKGDDLIDWAEQTEAAAQNRM